MSDRAVRVLVGISERSAAKMAHVCRHTLARHEAGETIRNASKRSRLETFYAWLRVGLGWSADASRGDDGVYDDDEATLPPPAHDSGARLAIPPPPRMPDLDDCPPTLPSSRAA